MKAELERLAERVEALRVDFGTDRIECGFVAQRTIARDLRALAARCDQPAGEPVPLPEPDHQRLVGTGPVPCWQSYYSADQLRTHAETLAAQWRTLALQAAGALQAERLALKTAERELDELKEWRFDVSEGLGYCCAAGAEWDAATIVRDSIAEVLRLSGERNELLESLGAIRRNCRRGGDSVGMSAFGVSAIAAMCDDAITNATKRVT